MKGKLRIDWPDFKAGPWHVDKERGHKWCEVQELIEGHWEGFVAIEPLEDDDKPTPLTEIVI